MSIIKSIIIVDDHQLVRKSFKLTLESYFNNAEILEACNGEELLEMIPGKTPDLIILDINMPIMNGVKCLHQLREIHNYEGKVIFISLNDAKEFIVIAKKIGANGYFTKNISPELLVSGIERVMDLGLFVSSEWFSLESKRSMEEINSIIENVNYLSTQETHALKLFVNNYTTKEVAEVMEITSKSVDNYKNRIGKKLLKDENLMFQDWIKKNGMIIELFI